MKKEIILGAIIALIFFSIASVYSDTQVGVKTGDWIRYDYTISGAPSGTPLPQWFKVEFLNVEGTTATIRMIMHMTDGTEQNQTATMDIATGSGGSLSIQGLVIPSGTTTGNTVYITGYGSVTIAGETTKAGRTVVHASVSQYGTQLTYYWDKQTGVMVEASVVSGTMTGSAKVTETNMWQAQVLDQTILYILVIVVMAVVAVTVIFFTIRRKKPPEEVALPAPQS